MIVRAQNRLLAVALFVCSMAHFVTPNAASAAGCIKGKLTFLNALGNYCDPTVRDCTGWSHTKDVVGTAQPVLATTVFLLDTNNVVIGQGSTSATTGNFALCWSGSAKTGKLKWYAEQSGGVFSVTTSSEGRWSLWTGLITLKSGTTSSAPQNVGVRQWGTIASPNRVANVYSSAQAMWWRVTSATSSDFSGVRIRLDKTKTATYGYDRKIDLSAAKQFNNKSVRHEMGHVAAMFASRQNYAGPDDSNKGAGLDYPACGASGWSYYATTCTDVTHWESTADVLAAMSLMEPNATNACISQSAGECQTTAGRLNLDSAATCDGYSFRRPADAMRAYWDMYDSRGDNGVTMGVYGPSIMGDALYSYPNGRDNHEKSENWCCIAWVCYPCFHNNKDMVDMAYHLNKSTSVDPSWSMTNNCMQ